MVHKFGNIRDLDNILGIPDTARAVLMRHTKLLTELYGEDRDIDNSDGGFVLWVEHGAEPEYIKSVFDYSVHIPECVDMDGDVLSAIYLLNNEYTVVIVVSINDAPYEILKELNDE